jgi:type II secretory pathway component GspD/PulD (secretin)
VVNLERSKIILAVVVGIAAVGIVWKVGFAPIEPAKINGGEPKPIGEPNKPADGNQPIARADANAPKTTVEVAKTDVRSEPNGPPSRGGRREFGGFGGPPGGTQEPNRPPEVVAAAQPPKPAEPNGPGGEPMELLNLRDVEMKMIIQKIADWTGKVVIPHDEAMKQKITIYSAEKLPRSKALAHIYSALRMKGYVAEHMDNAIYLTPIKDAKLGFVPTIKEDQPLAMLENKEQVVQKFFRLQNYKPTQMSNVVQPLIGDYGYVSADETTGTLLVIDTVANLMRIEQIINQFDVPEAGVGGTVTDIIKITHGDPSEIVQLLRTLLGQTSSTGRSSRGGFDGGFRGFEGQMGPRPSPASTSSSSSSTGSRGSATTVTVGSSPVPAVLIPEQRRKWIIVKATPEDLEQIRKWVEQLDRAEPVESEYETIPVTYADVEEVADGINQALSEMPGLELKPSVLIQPLQQSRQIMVFGRKDLREMVRKLVLEVDIPPGTFETRHFPLKHADPAVIKTNIEELFGTGSTSSGSSRGGGYSVIYNYGGSRRSTPASGDTVKVIAYETIKQVTVVAAPEKMEQIAKQIEEWDKPLDVKQVKPVIIELRNSDPVQLAELLNTLFSEKTTGRTSFFDLYFGTTSEQKKIVGPLYGQLTFEDVPGTKKIIVISKIPEAYDVIRQLVLDLDRQEMAEIPKVITLKYADPEDLSERLNAMFNEPGTTAPIRLTTEGLSAYSMESSNTSSSSGSSSSSSSNQNQSQQQSNRYTPPWSGAGARRTTTTTDSQPISNVIGKIRFVPDPHTKAILVLAPPEFQDEIEKLITQLDKPGKQVMIKAIVMEVDHTKMTSLGVELSTNPSAFGTLGENAIQALASLTNIGRGGATSSELTRATTTMSTANSQGSGTALGLGTDVYAVVDFLIKKTNAKVLNQQTLWTKDNQEASFFKGEKVAFYGSSTTSATAGNTQNFTFERVGMTLRARPSITPESNVDMIVNVVMSQLASDLVNAQPVRTEMDTTTNMIVKSGQSLLLGGILFQKDSIIQRKLPGLGDLPGVGRLFRHENLIQSNSEMLVFITPYVVETTESPLPEAVKEAQGRLDEFTGQLKQTVEKMEGSLPGNKQEDKIE